MAKPITATATVSGESARIIVNEIHNGTPNTPERLETIRRADEAYQRLMSKDRDQSSLRWISPPLPHSLPPDNPPTSQAERLADSL